MTLGGAGLVLADGFGDREQLRRAGGAFRYRQSCVVEVGQQSPATAAGFGLRDRGMASGGQARRPELAAGLQM
ncbi:hypothetical protein, partial [Nocardia sp. 852002-20019_SCH5090214]|uniref:hypothetical protein n=1 Tax=Nocardia sp. 852002-20019_SCH5090214 TaxID=1834087 RepID=UPI001E3E8ABB